MMILMNTQNAVETFAKLEGYYIVRLYTAYPNAISSWSQPVVVCNNGEILHGMNKLHWGDSPSYTLAAPYVDETHSGFKVLERHDFDADLFVLEQRAARMADSPFVQEPPEGYAYIMPDGRFVSVWHGNHDETIFSLWLRLRDDDFVSPRYAERELGVLSVRNGVLTGASNVTDEQRAAVLWYGRVNQCEDEIASSLAELERVQ